MNGIAFHSDYTELKRWFYRLAAGPLPAKDYPPAQFVRAWINVCKEIGRDDLAEEIMQGWNNCFDKYAHQILKYRDETGRCWAAAYQLGNNSITKNVFKHKTFSEWLKSRTEGDEKVPAQAKKLDVVPPPKGVPAIAIPKANEEISDWAVQAEKTKKYLEEIKQALSDNDKFIKVLEGEIGELTRKIADYGPGGKKSVNKDGSPAKYSLSIPKWQASLEVYQNKLSETKSGMEVIKNKMTAAESNYRSNPCATVEYEKEAQKSLEGVLEVILNVDDLKKQQEMLKKFNDMLKKMESQKTASMDRYADFWDKMTDAFNSMVSFFSSAWKDLTSWVKSLFVAVDKFDHVATDLGRY
jgi:hypothetical protein